MTLTRACHAKQPTVALLRFTPEDILPLKHPSRHPSDIRPPKPAVARSPVPRTARGTWPIADQPATSRLPRWVLLGPLLLFAAGSVFGMLEVHSSTDTWIGLAAGRQILEQTRFLNLRETFPKMDTFSFTFEGQPFFNQNWLTHVYFWLLYDGFGRSAVIIGTWALCVAIFTFVLLATRVRSGSWLAATLAASLVAIATRDWVSPRPATMQFFCLATLWFLLSVLLRVPEGGADQRTHSPRTDAGAAGPPAPSETTRGGRAEHTQGDRRWWAILALLPLLVVWSNAHGSFLFGYGLVGLFGACWLVARAFELIRRRRGLATITDAQALVVGLLTVLAAGLTIMQGPFGLENFTHQFKVTTSPKFREVGEWHPPDLSAHPPYRAGQLLLFERIPVILRVLLTGQLGLDQAFPPVGRFWWALRAVVICFVVALLLRLAGRFFGAPPGPPPLGRGRYPLQALLVDVAAVAIGLYMAFFARRFAPILYILATPALVVWLLLLCGRLSSGWRVRVRDVLVVASWPAALAMAGLTWRQAYADLVEPFRGRSGFDLLARVTRLDGSSREVFDFLTRNELRVKLLTEWTQAGVVMFHVPSAQVFMDGRAQQVYSEEHYVQYSKDWWHSPAEGPQALARLTELGTDTVLLRAREHAVMHRTLVQSGRWLPVLYGEVGWRLYMRADSQPMRVVLQRERTGQMWWPENARGHFSRGRLLLELSPLKVDQALEHLKIACGLEPQMGLEGYPIITSALVHAQRREEAEAYLLREAQRIQGEAGLETGVRELLVRTIQECLRTVRKQSGVASPEKGG